MGIDIAFNAIYDIRTSIISNFRVYIINEKSMLI